MARTNYFDGSNGASITSRSVMEALGRHGFAVEALTGTVLESGDDAAHAAWLAERGFAGDFGAEEFGGEAWTVDTRGGASGAGRHYRLEHQGVAVTLHRSTARAHEAPDLAEREGFLRLYETVLDRFRPDVLLNYGGDPLAHEVRSRARAREIAVVFALHNFNYRGLGPFETADAAIVPSRFAAGHYRKTLGLECTVLYSLVDFERARAPSRDPRYVAFVNPSHEKGVFVFARIADELGRRRPEIPLLVVESRGDERTLAGCGLDLRAHGNVHLMGHTPDPRRFWSVARIGLMPSLWWENQPLVAIEAMINGVPVVGSDRGGMPEVLGGAGVVLPLPGRLTPFTRELPTAEEVGRWIDAIERLWDDADWYEEQQRRALAEARRWAPEALEQRYVRFFSEVRPGRCPVIGAKRPQASSRLVTGSSPGTPHDREAPARPSIEAGIAAIQRRWPALRGECDDDPVFVLAAGWRSGSTLLQRLLMRSCFLWGEPFGHAGAIEAMADPVRCFTDQWPEDHHFHKGETAEELERRFIANLCPPVEGLLQAHRAYFDRLFAEPARRQGSARWGLKEVRLDCDHAVYLKWLFPRAKVLFLVRNPYDAWRSYAARAARGWRWYRRWPDEPLTVRAFARHWRRLASSFIEDHYRVDGLVVWYEDLARHDYTAIEDHLGFPVSEEAGRLGPDDGGPPPLGEMLASDRVALEEELGALAEELGYAANGRAGEPRRPSPSIRAVERRVGPERCVVLVPVGHRIEPACDDALRELERRGYTVRRALGYSAIDQGRNQMATDALRDGFEELFWIDSDIAFGPEAVERLRSHDLPIACGIYPKKGETQRCFACTFPPGTERVGFGASGELIEVEHVGAGFLHTRRAVYQTMQEQLKLPACNERFGPSMVPFFQPSIVPDGAGHWYLAEDYSFCRRARECGFRIVADTTIRLGHIGAYPYTWEDAGAQRPRYDDYTFRVGEVS